MNKLEYYDVYMGCDPEFFFSKKGEVVGAERVLSKDGIIYDQKKARAEGRYTYDGGIYTDRPNSKIVIDGVQAELNPRYNACRANLGNEIGACFRELYEQIRGDKNLNVDFTPVVEISKKELESLSIKSRVFGCAPSMNIHTASKSKISVDPSVYRFRSAGGHIHLGLFEDRNSYDLKKKLEINKILMETFNPNRLVPILDIILGNTCVLIDRNELAKERRKVYGKAGEYRLPPYGLEYRTLSNFWLQSYQLMSFVMGLARMGYLIVFNTLRSETDHYEKYILNLVNEDEITEAINNNDFDLAYSNFKKIEKVLVEIGDSCNYKYPINSFTIKEFHHFIKKGVNYWFKTNPLEHWMKLPEGHETGWEAFCKNVVKKDMDTNGLVEEPI